MSQPLSPALEDYLETILQLSEEGQDAKISDIARRLNIAKPSVTQAINVLKKEGMVSHVRYGPVILTDKGLKKAQEVWHRHEILRTFLSEVLKVSPATADTDACLLEHIISTETFGKIEDFLSNNAKQQFYQQDSHKTFSLNDLAPGKKARVVKVCIKDTWIKKRLLDMGVVPGVEVEVERVAPLGDPVEILLKGYHLSLRRSEAAAVTVELL